MSVFEVDMNKNTSYQIWNPNYDMIIVADSKFMTI